MLKFNSRGKFGFLLFGDIHEHDDWETSLAFTDMHRLMEASLDTFRPDICILLGDNLSTDILAKDGERFRRALSDLIAPMRRRGIPVYSIMGNHEHDPGIDDEVLRAYADVPGITMLSSRGDSRADYYEIVYSQDGERALAVLWFLDSNNLYPDSAVSKYDCVHPDQIEWFEKEQEKIKEKFGSYLPSYIFQHTPVPEEYKLLRKAKLWEYPFSARGFNSHSGTRYVAAPGTEGYVGEGPCSPDVNSGQFESWKKSGSVKAAFFGHDHLNDFSGTVDGIFLAQHKTAGFRAYTDGCKSCVRYVELDENSPGEFTQTLRHFKEFGLRSLSLGPVLRTINDRQSMALHVLAKAGVAAAAVTAAAIIIKRIRDKR